MLCRETYETKLFVGYCRHWLSFWRFFVFTSARGRKGFGGMMFGPWQGCYAMRVLWYYLKCMLWALVSTDILMRVYMKNLSRDPISTHIKICTCASVLCVSFEFFSPSQFVFTHNFSYYIKENVVLLFSGDVCQLFPLTTLCWNTFRSARLSILFTVIRIFPCGNMRTALGCLASSLILAWVILMGQTFWHCEFRGRWTEEVWPQCYGGNTVAIPQIIGMGS